MGKWDWSRLDGLAQIAKGRLLPTSGLRFESSVRYLGAADLEGRDSGLYSPTSNAVLCDEDDVLMLWDGERSGLVGCGLSGAAGSTVARIRPLRAKVVSKYLYHYLTSRFAEIQSLRTGTGVPHVPRDLKSFLKVPVPPLEEQRRIAEILDTIDETIQATEGAIAKLRFAHEALQQQLVPARAIDGVEEALLGALVDPKRPIVYGILMPGEHVVGGVPVIKVKDIKNGEIASRQTLLHTSPLIDQQYARSRVRKEDLLFTIRGSVGRTAIVPESHDGANITQDTARIAATGVNRSYLVAVMGTERFARFVGVHTIGQAVKGINLRELRRAPISLIGRNEQEIAGAALDGSIASIGAECERLEKLRLLRAGLAADLLSGRVRPVAA